jgi:hypothetical protein
LEQLVLVPALSEIGPTANAREFVNYETLSRHYLCTYRGGNTSMLDARDHAIDGEPIEEVDNVQVGDVVIDRVGPKDVESALVTLNQCLE